MAATEPGFSTPLPPDSIICANFVRSSAVVKTPAWPATPPMR